MKRELQIINLVANFSAFMCAVISFIFIPEEDMGVFSLINSSILALFAVALFIYAVVLPVRKTKLENSAYEGISIFFMIRSLFAGDNLKNSSPYMNEDISSNMVFQKTFRPWPMFFMLVIGLITCIPSLFLNPDRFYRLCMLGYSFFFLVLFILSFVYQYKRSEENRDNRFSKNVKGIFLASVVLSVLISFGYVLAVTTIIPEYERRKPLDAWEAFKVKQQKVYSNGISGEMVTGFTEEEKAEIISNLKLEFGEDMLYRITRSEIIEKDDNNRYYSELAMVLGNSSSEDVYMYIYRKYLSVNDEYEQGKVILYLTYKSPSIKREDVFSQEEVQE